MFKSCVKTVLVSFICSNSERWTVQFLVFGTGLTTELTQNARVKVQNWHMSHKLMVCFSTNGERASLVMWDTSLGIICIVVDKYFNLTYAVGFASHNPPQVMGRRKAEKQENARVKKANTQKEQRYWGAGEIDKGGEANPWAEERNKKS